MPEVDFDRLLFTELREHVFGLGLLSLRYNVFEYAFKFIISNYAEYAVTNLVFDRATNEQRANALRALAKAKETNPIVLDHIDHLLTFFATCAENRNILMHSSQSWLRQPEKGALTLEKRLKTGGRNIYQLDLEDIKRVANDMIDGTNYLMEVDKLISEPKPLGLLGMPQTSLQKPPLPSKLNPHQPAVNLQTEPNQPEAS